MARRKQTNPQRTGAEGAADTPQQVATPIACSKRPTAPQSLKLPPFKEWVEIQSAALESACVPFAELSLQSLESDFWEGANPAALKFDFSEGPSAVSLRVPVLRNTLRQPYNPQEVVCQVSIESAVQPQTPRTEPANIAAGGKNHISEAAETDSLGVLGVFDGPSSGVSALVDLVRGGLVTLQAVESSTLRNGSAQDLTTQEPRKDFSPSSQAGRSPVLPSTPGTPQRAQTPSHNQASKSGSPGFNPLSQRETEAQPPLASLPRVRVWLNPAAFADAPSGPSDEQRRPAYAAMQCLFQWVRPDLDHRVESTGFEGVWRLEEKSLGSETPQKGEQLNKGEEEGAEVSDRKGKRKLDEDGGLDLGLDHGGGDEHGHHGGFDAKELYAAVRTCRDAPMLSGHFPALLPTLRPYQRRAAAWMVACERGPNSTSPDSPSTSESVHRSYGGLDSTSTPGAPGLESVHPLWLQAEALEGGESFWYNPFTGRLSRTGFSAGGHVRGGILADEMGLGKTVELLACILAHPWPGSGAAADRASADAAAHIARRRKERIECSCGETSDDESYGGSWVQCDKCLAWQHAVCVGYVPKKRRRVRVKGGLGAEAGLGKVGGGLGVEPSRNVVNSGRERKDEARNGEERRIGAEGKEGARKRMEGEEMANGGDVMGTDGEVLKKEGEVTRQGAGAMGQEAKAIGQAANAMEQAGGSADEPSHPTSAPAVSGNEPTDGGQDGSRRTLKRKRTAESEGTSLGTVKEDSYVPFTCGECSALLGGVRVEGEVGATLIVCPTAILQQWREEIAKHTRPGAVKVVVYEGVQRAANPSKTDADADLTSAGGAASAVVGAHDLARADVVLTTYDALRADLAHEPAGWGEAGGRALRSKKRYQVVPTPLTRLTWWRVCLDEAQMVESSTAKATEMALKLRAVNRWCISGTPIQRGLEDLYGLLKFLRADPFDSRFWWNRAFQGPYEAGHVAAKRRAHVFLRALMWRNSKADVQDEIGLPPQQERIDRLRFSAVEAHFYRRQHDVVAAQARDVIRKHRRAALPRSRQNPHKKTAPHSGPSDPAGPVSGPSDAASGNPGPSDGSTDHKGVQIAREESPFEDLADETLTHAEAAKLMVPLLRLRQACCHPQVGSSGIRSLTQQRSPMTMEEILGVLVEKARVEAEEAQRLMVSSLNGLGGLALIEGDRPAAIKAYREALGVVEENEVKDGIRTDPLQKLHTLHNLAQALGYRPNPFSVALLGGENTGNEGSDQEKTEGARRKELVGPSGEEDRKGKRKIEDGTETESNGTERKKRRISSVDQDEIVVEGGGGCQEVKLPPDVPRTLRDDKLLDEAEEIRGRYVAAFQAKLAAADKEYQKVHTEVVESTEACRREPGGSCWWVGYLRALPPRNEEALVDYVKEKLLENDRGHLDSRQKNASNLALRFRDIGGLQYVLQSELAAVDASRGALLESLHALSGPPTEELVERAGDCATCHTDMRGEMCAHCAMDELFQNYESRLFKLKANAMGVGMVVTAEEAISAQSKKFARGRAHFVAGIKGDVDKPPQEGPQLWDDAGKGLRQGMASTAADVQTSWAPSDAERILRCILDFMRRNSGANSGEGAVRAAKKHLEAMEGMRREFFKARLLAGAQRALLYALDELGMAVTRVRLRLPGETFESEVEKNVTVQKFEIPVMNARFTSEKFAAQEDLKKRKGSLTYLKTLKETRDRAASAASSGPGPSDAPKRPDALPAEAADGGGSPSNLAADAKANSIGGRALTLDSPSNLSSEEVLGPSQPGSPGSLGKGSIPGSSASIESPGDSEPSTDPGSTNPGGSKLSTNPGGSEPSSNPGGSQQSTSMGGSRPSTSDQAVPPATAAPGSSSGLGKDLLGSDEICPVCQERLGVELMVLPCGHMLCCKCALKMIERLGPAPSASSPDRRKLTCPTCRQKTYVGDIAVVNGVAGVRKPGGAGGAKTQLEAVGVEDRVEVKGSLSTKMDAVVRRVLWVSENDPAAKFLIFSTWHDVLDLVAHALRSNGVPFERAKGRAGLNPAIKRFRKPFPAGARALLLPIAQGANGLNLVEAQHVVLVEPLLNPGAEAQAVGRVHRIGQMRPTFVHRFIIEGSVEEGVLALGKKKAEADGGELMGLRKTRAEDALTLRDLGSLFGKEGEDERHVDGDVADGALMLQSASEDSGLEGQVMGHVAPGEAAALAAEARRDAALRQGEE
ncbi:hypothetical protein KFL_000680200 [Klebsormidium nitens]|uniref:RING-type domain-containing protein n=1 Tax=Klebsormidium nitens TaxID=105231 RepID=A0A0U9HIZ5_KLENI|nr:hypothetical protein KFL_000680200 [Klebsormidium nitens]|eukprot:GAQ81004.1 hypothetical protein KFL_000680200 [Klebsormidium nitens]